MARVHLEARGYAIVDRNFRTRHGELDLVVADERCLVFCEVKTRIARGTSPAVEPGSAAPRDPRRPTRPFGPLDSIGTRKRRRLRLMAREWLAADRGDGRRRPELRFDAIGITLDPAGRLLTLEHLENAF
jgi:putative endonuclease